MVSDRFRIKVSNSVSNGDKLHFWLWWLSATVARGYSRLEVTVP